MKVISVDNEKMAVVYMERLFRQVEPETDFKGFTKVEDVYEHLSMNKADIALLDIEMGKHSGIELAKRCKELCPQINIIFVTGYSQYTLDALRLHASGYLMKPARADDLLRELDNLLYPIHAVPTHRVRIQTFGNFEIFVDGQPLRLPLLHAGKRSVEACRFAGAFQRDHHPHLHDGERHKAYETNRAHGIGFEQKINDHITTIMWSRNGHETNLYI